MATKPATSIRIAAIVLVLPCLFVAWQAYQWGIGDRHAYEARQIEKQWRKDALTRELLADATTKAQNAVDWAPGNPSYRDQLARLLLMQHRLDGEPATARKARQQLLESKRLRPDSPDNLAIYIKLSHQTGDNGAEFSDLIIQATVAGPWQPSVLQAVTQAGVANFSVLSKHAKAATLRNIERGFNSNVNGMPAQTTRLIKNGASDWSVPFIQALSEMLLQNSWETTSQVAKSDLALLLWPLLERRQQNVLAVKIARAITKQRSNALLRRVRDIGQLPLICLHLPRNPRFSRACQQTTFS